MEMQNFGETSSNNCRVFVTIPIKNEAENLDEALSALANQVDFGGRKLEKNLFEIIIFANNCTDESAEIVRSWQRKNPIVIHLIEKNLPPEKANVGYARRWLMNEADRRLRRNKFGGGVILTTDGDTRVAPDWVAANLREIENGAEAVGGRILIKPKDLRRMETRARRFHLLDTGYRLAAAEIESFFDPLRHDPASRHHQHFNASFAVTTTAFRRAGGVPEVKHLEDVAFYHALLRTDARVRHSPLVRVHTSSRLAGRTELGLSTQISEWTVMGQNGESYYVESAAAIVERAACRKILRGLWRQRKKSQAEISILAEKLLIEQNFLASELEAARTFGILAENIERAQRENGWWREKYPLDCVTRALAELRHLRVSLRNQTAAFSQTSSR